MTATQGARRRVKVKDDPSDAKRKLNKPAANPSIYSEDERGPKPGLESSVPHIALMYTQGRDNPLAQELTRSLLPSAARSLGVLRRK